MLTVSERDAAHTDVIKRFLNESERLSRTVEPECVRIVGSVTHITNVDLVFTASLWQCVYVRNIFGKKFRLFFPLKKISIDPETPWTTEFQVIPEQQNKFSFYRLGSGYSGYPGSLVNYRSGGPGFPEWSAAPTGRTECRSSPDIKRVKEGKLHSVRDFLKQNTEERDTFWCTSERVPNGTRHFRGKHLMALHFSTKISNSFCWCNSLEAFICFCPPATNK